MSISINQDISFQDLGSITVGGAVTSNKPVTEVIVDVSDTEGGVATFNQNGSWNFTTPLGSRSGSEIDATVLYSDGTREQSGDLVVILNTPLDHQVASIIQLGDGAASATVYNSRGHGLYDLLIVPDGEGSLFDATGRGGPGIAYTAVPADAETIDNFRVAGPRHDTLNLSDTGLQTLAGVLHHTTMSDGSATIHTSAGESVTLTGVTKQQLAANPHDLVFTGGHTLNM